MSSKLILKIFLAIIVSVVVGYLFINIKAAYKSAVFYLDPESTTDSEALVQLDKVDAVEAPGSTAPSPDNIVVGRILNSEVADDWLSYPELGIKAPIFWDVPVVEANDKMNDGLTHIQSTALPGNGGEGLISGHSSHYWWQKGDYKEIFALLLKAKIGDKFIINKAGMRIYQVDNIYQVSGNEYMQFQTSGEEKVKLMTCVPLGTNLRRLIVEAKLISVL